MNDQMIRALGLRRVVMFKVIGDDTQQ